MAITPQLSPKPRVLIVGGGYAGITVARKLQKKVRDRGGVVTVVDPNAYMTYLPFLPEVLGGHIEARHATVDLHTHLKHAEIVQGSVVNVSHAEKIATVAAEDGEQFEIPYQDIVMTAGSNTRVFPIDGLDKTGIGMKTIEEAVTLRNQILERVESAALMTDAAERRRALTFVLVGGGFAGVETISEIDDLVRNAIARNSRLSQSEARIVLVEAMGRIMPEVSEAQAEGVVEHLRDRGIEVLLNTSLDSAVDYEVKLKDMRDDSPAGSFYADTIVWSAGVAANGMAKETDFPVDDRGRIEVTPTLQISDGDGGVTEGAWGCGDICAVPDLTGDGPGGFCVPNAQHAGRQAKRLAENLLAVRFGEGVVEEYYHKSLGTVAGMGLGKGVGNPLGVELNGLPAWLAHRVYHAYALPTLERKSRVVSGWIQELLWGTDTTQTKRLERPFNAFRKAAGKPEIPSRFTKKTEEIEA
ncbi:MULTISPECIES: NAD(P)/FAD-dependent oxidoreductase [Auritidibacter]|uniref:FAD-dependent oxidoreductase n=1 Tax=Auritidibacter ignavus TaxID=678932 RepID=A0AAJ6DDY2_9MICC|nr:MULTISPECIES: FAD-dependent oxidoreductase [Auritidibacter]NIH71791.1 NADH dehydrogenase [Auritidibacter ignavus]PXA75977.1 NADH dehydrogenase FAD-containing subunit [Auritidibacter sp. NML100628]PXA80167.1 NADH dehydrogenase FAD-containing subunit [Auritidibacter sp. NML120636]RMX21811.1 NAD(P)/FAD-dependent oxidoreductase [Auritidibacter ignavus]WGH82736.1 FAD-dependent oxidoreductase [Auritidibacter ignavus]